MRFDRDLYLSEMRELLERAKRRWQEELSDVPIFAVNIWTDPAALASAVGLETRSNSDKKVAEMHEFALQERNRLLKRGDQRMADLFLPPLAAQRNESSADFAYRNFAETEHVSFDYDWGESEACWKDLEPALIEVRDLAMQLFRGFKLDPDAEVAVSSRNEWYDHPRRFH